MHNEFEPKIVLRAYDFYLVFYLEIKKWPKPERYNLGEKCEDFILGILSDLIFAARVREKNHILTQANVKVQVLKHLLRVAKEIKILPEKKYLFLAEKICEIGRMLGGWLKSV